MARDGVLLGDAFRQVLADRTARARRNGELMGVISTRLDDLAELATAFGTTEAQQVQRAWRAAAVRHRPDERVRRRRRQGRRGDRRAPDVAGGCAADGDPRERRDVGGARGARHERHPGRRRGRRADRCRRLRARTCLVEAARDASARASDSDDASVDRRGLSRGAVSRRSARREAVADAAHGLDPARPRGRLAELAAQVRDVHLDRPRVVLADEVRRRCRGRPAAGGRVRPC